MPANTLEFDEASHTYTVGGLHVPNVTTCLNVISSLAGIPEGILEYKRQIGTATHFATELYDQGILDETTLADEVAFYFEGWKKFLDESGFVPLEIEQRVYHPRHHYAGTLDRIGIFPNSDDLAVVDIKTSAVVGHEAGPQTAAYQEAYNYRRHKNEKAKKRYTLQLKPDGSYNLSPCQDENDFNVFLSCLNIHNWRVNKK